MVQCGSLAWGLYSIGRGAGGELAWALVLGVLTGPSPRGVAYTLPQSLLLSNDSMLSLCKPSPIAPAIASHCPTTPTVRMANPIVNPNCMHRPMALGAAWWADYLRGSESLQRHSISVTGLVGHRSAKLVSGARFRFTYRHQIFFFFPLRGC